MRFTKFKNSQLVKKLPMICTILGFVVLGAIFLLEHIQQQRAYEQEITYEKESNQRKEALKEASKITLYNDATINLNSGTDAEVIVSYDTLLQNVEYISGYLDEASLSFKLQTAPIGKEENLYMLVFMAHTQEHSAKMTFTLDGQKSVYYVTCQPSAFYLPINKMDNFSITLNDEFQNTYIGNIEIVEIAGAKAESNAQYKYGQYDLTENTSYTPKLLENIGCKEVLVGEYIYVLYKNELKIYSESIGEKNEVGKLVNLGDTSHMAFVNETMLVITARANDVYFVDVSNPKQPIISSSFDSLNLATGVAVSENYVFVCSRYYGVEIVDISDIKNPKLCSLISTGGECIQSCYEDGYLYISIWNEQTVLVYDVSNPNKPKEIQQIGTDGNPYGVTIYKDNLFVATGHHSNNDRSTIWSSGYGAGHGMEIYDISDVKYAEWKSTVKIDGRLYYAADDSWGVYVNGSYAFVSSTYGGVHIYNIESVEKPVKVGNVEVKILNASEKYNYNSSEKYVFPYNPELYLNETFSSIGFDNGIVYLAGSQTGLYSLTFQDAQKEKFVQKLACKKNDGSYFENFEKIKLNNLSYNVWSNDSCVNAVAEYKDVLFVACGDNGIEIITKSGKRLHTIDTTGPAQDILVRDDYAYVAEGNQGIEIFRINSDYTMKKVQRVACTLRNETITQLEIADQGKYMIAQSGWTRIGVFDISDPQNVKQIHSISTGTMYFRNLFNNDSMSKYLGYASSKEIKLYADENGQLKEISTINNSVYGERDGMCIYSDLLISITGGGYIATPINNLKQGLNKQNIYSLGNDYKLKGKVTCHDGVMVVTDAYEKTITIIDITNIENPRLIERTTIDGQPDVGIITKNYIFIPLKYQGLLIIKR